MTRKTGARIMFIYASVICLLFELLILGAIFFAGLEAELNVIFWIIAVVIPAMWTSLGYTYVRAHMH